ILLRICSFASNGASVMMGKNTGVDMRIAQINTFLYIMHCIAHRLSLSCGYAQGQVESCKSVEFVMKKVYLFFGKSKWLKDKESLMLYGELELEELVSVYGKKYLPDYPLGLIDSVAIQEEWFGFKIVVDSNYQDLAIDLYYMIII
ncbi:10169_t:CDS:2, partial [Entrophospora sp. SA101]